jgi:hypothetical protein
MNQTLVEPLLFVPVRNIATAPVPAATPKPAVKTPQPAAEKS